MSNSMAIATATMTLKHIIDSALKALPQAMRGPDDVEVKTGRPTPTGSELPDKGVNVYLYQVTPSAAFRAMDVPTRSANGAATARPVIAVDLHYLLSFHGEDRVLQPQLLMGVVLGTLHARPILSRTAVQQTINTLKANTDFAFLEHSNLANALEAVRLTPVTMSLEEMSKIWSVFFQTPYRLSIAYQAGPLFIEQDDAPIVAPVVKTPVVRGTPFGGWTLDRVVAASGAGQPVTGDSVALLEGRGFGLDAIVRIDGVDVMPDMVSASLIRVRIPATTRPGIRTVIAVQTSTGAESNIVPVVVHARLVAATVSGVAASGDLPDVTYAAEIKLVFDLPVGRDQRVELVVQETTGEAQTTRRAFEAVPRPNASNDPLTTTQVTVKMAGLRKGTYRTDVRIDGTLVLPDEGAETTPTVTLP